MAGETVVAGGAVVAGVPVVAGVGCACVSPVARDPLRRFRAITKPTSRIVPNPKDPERPVMRYSREPHDSEVESWSTALLLLALNRT